MCTTVLQALTNALVIARRKQQIAKSIVECELYLKDLGPRILKAVYEARLPFTLDGFISSESLSKKELLARKPILNSQYLQYKMADKLRLTLVNNNSDEQKIEDFTTKFKKYRVRLENSKDPRALRFTKIICAIFAIAALGIGLFFASRITASKGGNVASRLQKILR